ncbi:prenyltransferase/squalene oxidase repeat-containing protein [Streptomyces andamanensis]|uniref:Prenyltransferase/squalene oxidase repeat-containing protein n=1 Tax=Streptomyces andamanensis TaxID=1565035 RepID=A0ABV8TKI5_9ACTN
MSLGSALLVVLATCVAFLTTAPAAADGADGCTATHGAVVAVDFGPFGGKVERGCDPAPTTGYNLLHQAGFTTTGTQHDGPGFLCRIGYGAFHSGTEYPTPAAEDCVLTPPATAYWSYWVAAPGDKDWTYSSRGAMTRTVKDGDVDAWVFGGTDIGGTKGKPAFSPDDVRVPGGHTPDPGGSGTPTGAPGELDTAAAAAWLAGRLTDDERIVDDGATTANYELTADTAYALAAANGRNATLDKVTGFLAAHVADYAYPNGAGQAPDATAAARLALLAETTERDPHAFGGHDLIDALASHVCTAGPESGPAPGCTAAGDFRTAFQTEGQALSVLALLRAGQTPPAASVDRLARLQCKDGGITSILIRPGEYCDGDPATTGLVALVLHRAGGHDDTVDAARTYLTESQSADGAFPGYTGSTTGSVTATAYAAQALRALGDTRRADAAVGWLSRHQLDGGGFGFEETDTDPVVHPTSPAVLAGAGTSLVTVTTKPSVPPTSGPPTEPGGTPSGSPTGPTSSPGGPAPGGGTGPDLKKGVAYLTAPAQLQQGRYYTDAPGSGTASFGLTIDGAYALAATGLDNARLRGIVDFLDSRGKDATGSTIDTWTGIGTAHVLGGSVGKAAVLAEAVGRDPRNFTGHDLIATLAKAVCTAPSKAPDRSCPAKGAYTYAPSVFSQSLGVLAQLRAGEKTAAQQPIAYLESLQHPSGAWPSLIPSTGDSEVDSTAMAAMTLDLAGGDTAKQAVRKALAWLASRQLPDGGFPGASGDSVNSTGLAVQGLSLDKDTYAPQITRALAFLAAQQNADGGFNVAKEGQRGSDVRASAQAVGGATGISFGTLKADLTGTSPQPGPTSDQGGGTPDIITAGETGGTGDTGGASAAGGGGGGALASTGVQATALAAVAALLVLAGWRTAVAARRRADAHTGSER